jgi:hypothetical protein
MFLPANLRSFCTALGAQSTSNTLTSGGGRLTKTSANHARNFSQSASHRGFLSPRIEPTANTGKG